MRCFVAIELDSKTRAELAPVLEKIAVMSLDCTPVLPEALHLTLAFLGEKNPRQLSDICANLSQLRFPSFNLEVLGVGVLPNDNFVRVFYAGVRHCPELASLAAGVCSVLDVPVFHAFSPHITLARITSRKNIEKLIGLKSELSNKEFARFGVESFVLKQSMLSPQGASYVDLACFPLQPHK